MELQAIASIMAMTLGQKITRWVDDRGISKSELARRVGVTHSAVNNWMSDKSIPGFDAAIALSKEMGVSLDFLADDGLDEPEPPDMTEAERAVITTMRGTGLDPEQAIQAIVFFATTPRGEVFDAPTSRRVEMAGPSATHAATKKPVRKKSGSPVAKPVRDHEGSDPKNVPGGVR